MDPNTGRHEGVPQVQVQADSGSSKSSLEQNLNLPGPSSQQILSNVENELHDEHNSGSTSSTKTHSDKLSELPTTIGLGGNFRSSSRISRRAPSPSSPAQTTRNSPRGQAKDAWDSSPASTGHVDTSTSAQTQSQSQLQAQGQRQSRLSDFEEKVASKARFSFDSERSPFSNVRQAVSRLSRPTSSSQEHGIAQHAHNRTTSHSPARSPTRSPLRILWPLHRVHSRDEPFVPVNPYNFFFKRKQPSSNDDVEQHILHPLGRTEPASPSPYALDCDLPAHALPFFTLRTLTHLCDQIFGQLYLHILLRLPSIYFSRVCRLFEDAEVSRPEIDRLIERAARGEEFPGEWEWGPPNVSPALSRFKKRWEEFVESVLKEWKTLNLVSALLLSAIITLLQIPSANSDPVTRTSAILSLISALWSLCFGCVYILRFGTMKSMYKASRWAEASKSTTTSMWWNVWVLLATPAIWLAWSMISFCVSILSFVWRTDTPDPTSSSPPDSASSPSSRSGAVLGPRIGITCVFTLGLVYFVLVMKTFSSYGGSRKAWRKMIVDGEERLLMGRMVKEPEGMVTTASGDKGHANDISNGHANPSDRDLDATDAVAVANALGLNLGLARTTSHESAVTVSTSGALEKIREGDENVDHEKQRKKIRRLSPSPSLPIF